MSNFTITGSITIGGTYNGLTITNGSITGGTFNGATLNNLPWATYSPVVTAQTGTFTSVSATGRFKQIGKIVFVQIDISVTTNGSAATNVMVTLPVTATTNNFVIAGREFNSTGKMLQGFFLSTTQIYIQNYDGSYPAADGYQLVVSGQYEAA